jgi:signal peptidase I
MAKKVFLKKYNHRKLEWLHDSLAFIVSVVVVFIVFRFIIGFSLVSGDSMYPTLQNGEAVVYLRTVSDYRRGDIISIWVPSGDYYVKRVIAVAGDVVDIRDGELYVNDELVENTYGTGETLKQQGAVIYPYKVREGNVFAVGDNRAVSVDSRSFGEVNKIQIRGKIFLRLGKWYVKRAGT